MMYDLLRKVLGYKTADQKYNQYFLAQDQLRGIDQQLNEMSREFTVKNEVQKSICSYDIYEDEVKTRVREKFAGFLKSYSEELSTILDDKAALEHKKSELEMDSSLIFQDLKKAMLTGSITPDVYLQVQENIEKAKNPKHKVAKVMREYEDGKLQSSSGDKVKDRDQAIAIAMSEAGIKKGDIDKADPCWQGHEMVGMKSKDGKEVPNCVKKACDDDKLPNRQKYIDIQTKKDLEHAINNFTNATPEEKAGIKALIVSRAIDLDATVLLPPEWEVMKAEGQQKVTEMALTKGEKHYPGETKEDYQKHEEKESAAREKKEHGKDGYEQEPAASKDEFKLKEKDFEAKNPNFKKGEGISDAHIKDMIKEHERLIPLLERFGKDPEVAKELATQKEELAKYSQMINKADYYHPKDATVVNGDKAEEDRDFLDKGYQLVGYNINAKNEIDHLDFDHYPDTMVEKAEYQGKEVKLGKPMPGDVKKYKVYVTNQKGNIVKVEFGDPNMEIKRDNPDRRRSFRARHKCDEAKDKTSAGYWSCKMWSKTPVSQLTKAMDHLALAAADGEIDEFEYNSWLQKAKSGKYADNEMNRRLGRVGEKYGSDEDEEEDEEKKKDKEPKGEEKEEKPKKEGDVTPASGSGGGAEDAEQMKPKKVDALKQNNPRIKKLLEQARKTGKKNLEGAVNQSDDAELRAVAQQELERRKMEEGVAI